jgi:hypothetical protein
MTVSHLGWTVNDMEVVAQLLLILAMGVEEDEDE